MTDQTNGSNMPPIPEVTGGVAVPPTIAESTEAPVVEQVPHTYIDNHGNVVETTPNLDPDPNANYDPHPDVWEKGIIVSIDHLPSDPENPPERFTDIIYDTSLTVTREVYDARKETCRGCEFVVLNNWLCGKCLCPIANIALFKGKKCPVDKWTE
jgi:hypothetical protein